MLVSRRVSARQAKGQLKRFVVISAASDALALPVLV
jgi:hypothetical protein